MPAATSGMTWQFRRLFSKGREKECGIRDKGSIRVRMRVRKKVNDSLLEPRGMTCTRVEGSTHRCGPLKQEKTK